MNFEQNLELENLRKNHNDGKKLKILLLSPKLNVRKSLGPSMGLAYIQAYLKSHGYINTKLIDMAEYSFKKSEKVIKKENPDVVGISCLTANRIKSIKLAEIAKRVNPNIKTILGGPHVDFFYEQILTNYPFIDYIVFGEGEITAFELINAINRDKPLSTVKGVAFRENGKIIKTERRLPVQNLDELPFPCYEDIDLDKYLGIKPFEKGKRRANIVSSRGCNYGCKYCSTTRFWGRWRARSAKNVVDEMEWLHKEYSIKYFFFVDDIFSVDEQRVIDICKEIIKRNLNITWWFETRPDNVSKDMLQWAKKSGCIMVEFGVESGSQKILDNLNKRVTIEQVINAFKWAKEVGLKTEIMLIVGSPGEDINTINETKNLLDIVRPDILVCSVLYIFPATPLYKLAKKQGIIDDSYWLEDKLSPPYTGEYTVGNLTSMHLDIIKYFYKSKGKIGFFKLGLEQLLYNPKGIIKRIGYIILEKFKFKRGKP